MSRKPRISAIAPATTPPSSGHAELRFKASNDVLRQARSGPTPVSKRRNSAMGIFTLLKNGGPTLILFPTTHSASTGKSVPHRTAKQAASKIKLLKRKLDSRDTSESS